MFRQLMAGSRLPIAVALLLIVHMAQGLATAQNRGSLYGARGISPQTVRQGTLGSCYFHATIASLAKARPETLRGAIRQTPDGNYQVRFFDGPEETVYVEDVAFGRSHSYDRSEGTWVAVLMRGYAQHVLRMGLISSIQNSALIPAFAKPLAFMWLNRSGPLLVAYDRAIRSVVKSDGVLDKAELKQGLTAQLSELHIPTAEAQQLSAFLEEQGFFNALARTVQQNGEVFGAYASIGQGGIPERVLRAFLGGGQTQLTQSRSTLLEQLRRLHAGSAVIVAGTYSEAPSTAYEHTDWWVPSHAFSVLDYEESSGNLLLRNPWGTHPGSDGYFRVPLPLFLSAWKFYSFSNLATP